MIGEHISTAKESAVGPSAATSLAKLGPESIPTGVLENIHEHFVGHLELSFLTP